jgi:hypothetical protein
MRDRRCWTSRAISSSRFNRCRCATSCLIVSVRRAGHRNNMRRMNLFQQPDSDRISPEFNPAACAVLVARGQVQYARLVNACSEWRAKIVGGIRLNIDMDPINVSCATRAQTSKAPSTAYCRLGLFARLASFVERTPFPAVPNINEQTDYQPDHKPNPGLEGKPQHQSEATRYRERRH